MIITHRYKVDRRIIYKELRNRGISIKKSRMMRDWRINIINKYLEASNLLKIEHLAKKCIYEVYS